jgi:hypothetical protein
MLCGRFAARENMVKRMMVLALSVPVAGLEL